MTPRVYKLLSIVTGVVVALGSLELALRVVASAARIPVPRIGADSFHTRAVTRRQIEEGVSRAHFSTAGARLTGNQPVGTGAVVIILGDSYVVAREVADEHTMGANLERAARRAGVSLDVRQYGWSGASPAQYLLVADEVRARWRPLRVIVVLSNNDLDRNALVEASPALRVDATGNAHTVGAPIDTTTYTSSPSALWMLTRHRWITLRQHLPSLPRLSSRGQSGADIRLASRDRRALPDSSELAALPGAVVRALAKAYGESLTLIYLAEVGLGEGKALVPEEERFLAACLAANVDCVSMRDDMLAARSTGIIARGASTRPLGEGHLNADGHALVGAVMWRTVRSAPGQLELSGGTTNDRR